MEGWGGKVAKGKKPTDGKYNLLCAPPPPTPRPRLSGKQLLSILRERKNSPFAPCWLRGGELDEWGSLAIHLVAGAFHRLQPPHSFSLLHCRGAIFSVLIFTQCNPLIGTLKKRLGGPSPTVPAPNGLSSGVPRAAREEAAPEADKRLL